jgi:hypothetical protein
VASDFFRLVLVGPAEAPLVGEVFRSVYGEAYIDPSVYQPESLLRKIDQGKLFAVLALDPGGRPAGYSALGAEAPNPFLWEEKGLVVVPEYNQTDVGASLVSFWGETTGWPAPVIGVFASPVCHHYFAQIFCAKAGWIASTIQLDLFDATIFRDRPEGLSRVSCVQFFTPMPPAEAPSYWPREYSEFLATITRARNEPVGRLSTEPLPDAMPTSLQTNALPSSRNLRINVFYIGKDWPEVVRNILTEASAQQMISIQVWLDTSCSCIGEAVRILRSHGFFLGGLAPRWFGNDGLLMQKVTTDTRYDLIKLYSSPARELFDFIRTDRAAVRHENEQEQRILSQ